MGPLKDFAPKHVIARLRPVAGYLAAAVVACAPLSRSARNVPTSRITANASVSLAKKELAVLTHDILRAFGDTLSSADITAMWERYGGHVVDIENAHQSTPGEFHLFHQILRSRGLSVFTLRPASYEAVRAVYSLPVITCAAVLRFPPSTVSPLSRDALQVPGLSHLSPFGERVCLSVVRSVRYNDDSYRLSFHDGKVLSGTSQDRLLGQVYPAETADGAETYHQVGGLFCVSRLSMPAVEGHLDEWFAAMPYTAREPEVVELR